MDRPVNLVAAEKHMTDLQKYGICFRPGFQQSPYCLVCVRASISPVGPGWSGNKLQLNTIQYNTLHTIRKLLFARTARKHKFTPNKAKAAQGILRLGTVVLVLEMVCGFNQPNPATMKQTVHGVWCTCCEHPSTHALCPPPPDRGGFSNGDRMTGECSGSATVVGVTI